MKLLIEEEPRLNRGGRPGDPRPVFSRSVPPEAFEVRAPDCALAALMASPGDLPKGAGQVGGRKGVRGPLVILICLDRPAQYNRQFSSSCLNCHHFGALPRGLPLFCAQRVR